ncbi:MAG: tRNA 2-selenouridine(34) synthase MnmH [Bacteroidota bacterium]
MLASNGNLILDVRSPAEYAHAHLPGALNLPLFSNEERKVVGTAYKQESRQQAIKIGLDYFGPKMRQMVEEVERLLAQNHGVEVQGEKSTIETDSANDAINTTNQNIAAKSKTNDAADFVPRLQDSTLNVELKYGLLSTINSVFVYCWRGGMRSGGVAWLLNLYGFNVTVLTGGYKSFRRRCLEVLQQPYKLKILGGYTGSGKTKVLTELRNRGEKTIDLEAIARHKGSAFGRIGDGVQPSQEMFENLLSQQLEKLNPGQQLSIGESISAIDNSTIWIEDESQRIGQVNIPNAFWNNMRRSPVCFLDIPFEERLDYITTEYGNIDPATLSEATQRITKRLGGVETKSAIAFIEEGNVREAFRILLRYYDKLYQKGLLNRQNLPTLLHKIECPTVTAANANALLKQYQTV